MSSSRALDPMLENFVEDLSEAGSTVAVASTIHEPKSGLLPAMARIVPLMNAAGLEWHISATVATKFQTGGELTDIYRFMRDNVTSVGTDVTAFPHQESKIEENHYAAIRLALERSEKPDILYVDADRLCMGLNYHPAETVKAISAAARTATGNKLAVIGRTHKAIDTHIASLVDTESIFHHFYTKHLGHLSPDARIFDVGGTGHIMPAHVHRDMFMHYRGGVLFDVPADFPHPKLILGALARTKNGVSMINTDNFLRYEAPEQMRGDGRLQVKDHSWTPECYDEMTRNSLPIQNQLMEQPGEWASRFRNVNQYLKLLNRMWLGPNGKLDNDMDGTIAQLDDMSREASTKSGNDLVRFYREKAASMKRPYWAYLEKKSLITP